VSQLAIAVLIDADAEANPAVSDMLEALARRGAAVDLVLPERELVDARKLSPAHDLYVLKSGTELGLTLAGLYHAQGARTLPPYPAAALLRDKFIVARLLQAAGIPTAESFVVTDLDLLVPEIARGPMIFKPIRGTGGHGIRVAHDPDSMFTALQDRLGTGTRARTAQQPLMAQRYLQPDGDGRDVKLFCLGRQVFAARRPSPLSDPDARLRGEVFEPGAALRQLALRVGAVFGIDVFGVDVVMSGGQPYVVDVNKFPSFRGIPGAGALLADHILSTARAATPRTERRPVASLAGV
jgi:ribosomal protein S6--L-glutamate ligase